MDTTILSLIEDNVVDHLAQLWTKRRLTLISAVHRDYKSIR